MTTLSDLIDTMAQELNKNFADLGDWLNCWTILRQNHSHAEIDACIDEAMDRAREERMREAA